MRLALLSVLVLPLVLATGASCRDESEPGRLTPGAAGATSLPSGSAGSGGDPSPDACVTEAACAGFRTVDGAVPPAPDPDAPTVAGEPLVLAIEQVFVGDTDRDELLSDAAWREFGFDLDGWNSNSQLGFHCKPIGDTKKSDIREDGARGIDNAWGADVVNGILSTLVANPTEKLRNQREAGQSSWLLRLAALGSSPSAAGLSGQWSLAEGSRDAQGNLLLPTEDDSYAWHSWDGSTVASSEGYLVDQQIVMRFASPIPIYLDFGSLKMRFPLQRAVLALEAPGPAQQRNGTLAGVIATEDLVASALEVAPLLDLRACDSSWPALVGILDSLRGASDILLDGTQDPARDCNAISFGVGLVARPRQLGASVPPPVIPSVCGP